MGTIEDVREELHASLGEVRSLVEQSRQAVFRVESMLSNSDAGSSQRVTERVEAVHAIADGTRRRQSLLIGVVIAQAVMLVIGLLILLSAHSDGHPSSPVQTAANGLVPIVPSAVMPASEVAAPNGQTLSSATEPTREPEATASDSGKRRRLRRHH